MPAPTSHRGSQLFENTVTFQGDVYFRENSIDARAISDDANNRLEASKQVHRVDPEYSQAPGTNVVSETKLLRLARGAGELKAFEVRPIVAPAGGDLQYTVDLQKAVDGSSSWTSLLDAVLTIDSSSADETKEGATLAATPTYAAGDALRIVVTVSGSTGTQGQGMVVLAAIEEQPS